LEVVFDLGFLNYDLGLSLGFVVVLLCVVVILLYVTVEIHHHLGSCRIVDMSSLNVTSLSHLACSLSCLIVSVHLVVTCRRRHCLFVVVSHYIGSSRHHLSLSSSSIRHLASLFACFLPRGFSSTQ